MQRLLCLIMALLFIWGAACAEETAASLDEWAAARFRERNIVGGAVVIMKDGEVLYRQLSYGA